jgi:hypothetical protein
MFQIAVLIIRARRKRESSAMDGHEEITMAKKLRYMLPVLAAFLFMGFVSPLNAAQEVKITAVITDYDSGQLSIRGGGLSDVDEPAIKLGGIKLTIASWNANEIVANVAFSTYELGTYLLVVDPNYKRANKLEMMITVGAEGPSNPGYYYLYTNGLRIPANGKINVVIDCHGDDFAIHAQEYVYGREETSLGSINEFYRYLTEVFNETSADLQITMLLSCMDFTRPFHQGDYEEAICVLNEYSGAYYCESSEH